MAVRESLKQSDESGQSVIEFLFILPLLVGMSVILVRINTAIQISIVDQQYSRAQATFLTFNNPYYPPLRFTKDMMHGNFNQMLLGVSDNIAAPDYTPEATVQGITRSPHISGPDAPKEEPHVRAKVRVRNTVTLCTRSFHVFNSGTTPVFLLPSGLEETTQFNFCGGDLKYEQ